MMSKMRIPKKLRLSFTLICVSAAVMMAVFFATIMMIRASIESNNLSRTIEAQAMSLETAILRQNSQFRGFLVTGDETYLKSYYEGRDEFDKVVVHGHTPVRSVHQDRRRIAVDTKAYSSGVLTALRLQGTTRSFLQTSQSADGKVSIRVAAD